MTKTRVLLLCGGQSGEHEVSLSSARSVIKAAGDTFEVTALVIDKTGKLLPKANSLQALSSGRSEETQKELAAVQSMELAHLDNKAFDIVFPLLHGPNGEDGSVQGMLKLMGLPFVGSDVLGSAVGMDKLMMKSVFAAHGLPQIKYGAVSRSEWQESPERVLQKLRKLGLPVFVKPANLGSSVGISKAKDVKGLSAALDEAARHDRRIIVEEAVNQPRELEVAVLGNDDPAASPVGEITYRSEFYDYAAKYTEGRADLVIPANIPVGIAEQCQVLALEAFKAVDAAGLARVDFFYAQGKLYLNEINTMPGFTTTSMYPKLWEAAGVSYGELVERLVGLGLERKQGSDR
ncbi:MAG: D-alanine--D-alanine ligase family protein [Trueperaceae bacterium]